MDPLLVELFCEGLPGLFGSVVGIVYDDLAAGREKVPDELLAAFGDPLAECDGFGGLLACDRVSDGQYGCGARTEGKVVGREGLCTSERLPTVVAERDDVGFHAHPSEIALECARDVGLSARRESDGEDEDLTRVPEQARRSRVERRCHRTPTSQPESCIDYVMQGIQLSGRHSSPVLLHLLIELCERLFDAPRPLFLSASGGDGEWRTEHGALFACTGRDRSIEACRKRNGMLTREGKACRLARGRVMGRSEVDLRGKRHRGDRAGMAGSVQEGGGLPPDVSSPQQSRFLLGVLNKDIGVAQGGRGGRYLRPSMNLPSYLARATAASPERWNETTAMPFERPWGL